MAATANLVFAVALMLDVGIPVSKNPQSATTRVFIPPAAHADSLECQRMALAFNKAAGMEFKGHAGGPYDGANGIIMGAWCVIAPVEKKEWHTQGGDKKDKK